MKKFSKIISIILCLLLTSTVNAATIGDTTVTTSPEGWEFTASQVESGNLVMGFDTTASAKKEKSEITTSAYDFSDCSFYLSFDSVASVKTNSSKVEQSISFMDDNIFNTTKVLSIKDGKLTVFNGLASASCSEDDRHKITLAVNPADAICSAWLDGSLIYSGDYDGWKAAFDLENLKIAFKNNASSSIADVTSWTISNFEMKQITGNYNLTTSPADGRQMVLPEELTEISVYFGTKMADSCYLKSNYTLVNSQGSVDFDVVTVGNDVQIVPENGFEPLESYTLTIKSCKDIWGNENATQKTVSFTTAYDGYIVPVVTLESASAVEIYKGQRTTVEFSVDKPVEYVEVYNGNQLVKTMYEAPYTYTMSGNTAGSYEISAIAYDEVGGAGTSGIAYITVLDHNVPVITVTGIENDASYAVSDIPAALIEATDDNGIKSIDVYVDGELYASENADDITFDLSLLSAGNHTIEFVATDIYGLSSSESYAVELVSDVMIDAYTNDFEEYAGKGSVPSGMQGNEQRGYLDVATIDADHGNSLIIGIDVADTSYTAANTAFVGIPAGPSSGKVQFTFDMNVSAKPADKYTFATKRTNGAQTEIFYITSQEMQLCVKNTTAGKSMDYTPGEWYKFKLDIDVPTHLYTISVTAPDGTITTLDGDMGTGYDVLDFLRIFGPSSDDVKSFIAIDNVVVKHVMDFPVLTIPQEVDYKAESITIVSSQTLLAEDIDIQNVKLYDEFGEVTLLSAASSDGKTIVIKPENPLKSCHNYTVVISGDVRYSLGEKIGASIEGSFTTTEGDLDIVSGTFSGNNFYFNAVNNTSGEKTVVAIVQKWNENGRAIIAKAVSINVSLMTNTYTVPVMSYDDGEYITVYLWDGLVNPRAVSATTWTLK